MSELDEPLRDELRELLAATRALLEQHRDAATFGTPRDATWPASLLALSERAAGIDAGPAPSRDPGVEGAGEGTRPTDANERTAGRVAASAPAQTESVAVGPAPPSVPPPVAPFPAPVPSVASAPAFALAPVAGAIGASTGALGISVPAAPDARLTRLRVLAETLASCTLCRLHEGRHNSVFARGNPTAPIFFVGEGPGADEDAQGLPFVGRAGQLLDRMIGAMGLAEGEFYIANVVKCRPPENRKPEPDEMAACAPHLAEQLALVEPQVIVALGATAAEGLLGARIAITRSRGQWKLYRASIPVMLTFHPAYLLRNPDAKRDVWADLRAVLERLGRRPPGRGTQA